MRLRLTRKLAERINGVDLSHYLVGEVLQLPDDAALCLVAKGWAVLDELGASSAPHEPAGAGLSSEPGERERRLAGRCGHRDDL